MAGGKETPRQKMIGMMYLVLTALLALQVSSAVLEKFAIIESTLEEVIVSGTAKSAATLDAIIQEAGKNQNPKVLRAKENAQKVRELTDNTIKGIEDLKKEMLKAAETTEINEKFINDHGSAVATMMIDKRKPHGKQFEDALNNFTTQLRQLSGMTEKDFPILAKAPKDMPLFRNDTDHANKSFLVFNFENTPPIAALATVTQIETEILEYENAALEKLRNDAGAGTIRFDKIVPMVRPKASIVAAGAKYEAQMFITASSSAITPTFYMDGQKLPVIDEGGVKMGKVEFKARGGDYDRKTLLARKTFKARIELADTAYSQDMEYFVAQPVIRVTTGNAPTLYMNCGNAVNIEVPALSTEYNPSFSSGGGAEIIKGNKPGVVTIIPKQRKIKVSVTNGDAALGSVDFDVKPIPRPRYVAKENSGKDIDLKRGIKGAMTTGFRVVAEAEENFKEEVPRDAVYRIRSMDVILARGTAPVKTGTFTNENLELSAWRSLFRPGDMLVIEIKTVTRRTFKGEDEKQEVKSEILRVPIE